MAFYGRLLQVTGHDLFRNGEWRLCDRSGWPDNQSCRNILAWCWAQGDERFLIVVNYSELTSQALVKVPWDELADSMWLLDDRLSGKRFERYGYDLREVGMYVELGPWRYHLFAMQTV